uniref:Uncharacterized protein n=1 Tax=Panagrolaimus davidi TaxID=227884 RepID=A0A914PTW6_9BILA
MPWQNGITDLSATAQISRATKLEHLKLDWIYENLTPQIISNFIIKQMSNSSFTELCGMGKGADCACKYEREIRDVISKKLENAKFEFNVYRVINQWQVPLFPRLF